MTNAMNPDPAEVFDRYVLVDWKSPGIDFLDLFTDTYPELEFLTGADFNALVDELANEGPEECIDVLAEYLARHGHSLWNLDPHSDTFGLAIVAVSREEDFLAHWREDKGGKGFVADPLRLEPATDTPASPRQPVRRKPAPELVEESLIFEDAVPCVSTGWNETGGGTPDCYSESGTPWQLDLSFWPPQQVRAPSVPDQPADCRAFYEVHSSGGEHWWIREFRAKKRVKPRRELVRIVSFEPYAEQLVQDGTNFPGPFWPRLAAHGACVFVVHSNRSSDAGWRYELRRHVGGSSQTWLESDEPMKMVPLDAENLLAFGAQGAPLHLSRGQPPRPVSLPFDLNEAVSTFALSGHEFVSFTTVERPHPEAYGYVEERLQMHRVDLLLAVHRSVVLDDLVACQRIDLGGGKVEYRSFDGYLNISRGHGAWWILNYVSQQFGKKDLAWLWNSQTDEVLRIGSELFPRLEPTFVFLASSGRYVARTEHCLRRLVDFETLRPHLLPLQLNWSAV